MNLRLLDFQEKAVEKLRSAIDVLWQKGERTQIILKSPTGSGKTLMTCALIDRLQNITPEHCDVGDVAFFWATLNNDLVMQSRDKFYKYFMPNLRNHLSTFDDCGNALGGNEILFVNWQKLAQKKGKERLLLRRPRDIKQCKESGVYFEDIFENTAKVERKIIMIVDESHSNVGTELSQEIIDIVNPKLILKISATPFKTDADETNFYAQKGRGNAEIVEVEENDVVAAGLIKEEIVCQTQEDLARFATAESNIDNVMLSMAVQKRLQIKEEWFRAGENINPLVLIQLPNDEGDDANDGEETHEAFTRRILKSQYGIEEKRIATWLADKEKKAEWRLEEDDSPIDFLIFKCAAGTGWDCPRAHILVMFREIKSPVFQIQTLGRIKRMAVNGNELGDFVELKRGYLYTTYNNGEVIAGIPPKTSNAPKTKISKLDKNLIDRLLPQTTAQVLTTIALGDEFEELENDCETKDNLKRKIVEVISNGLKQKSNQAELDLNFGNYKASKAENVERAQALTSKIGEVYSCVTGQQMAFEQTKQIVEEIQKTVEVYAGTRTGEIILDEHLKSQFLSRADYGDLGKASVFQAHFLKSMNDYFGMHGENVLQGTNRELLEREGIDLKASPEWEIMVNKVFRFGNADNDDAGTKTNVEVSPNDISRMFNNCCYELLKNYPKIGNVARSWGLLSQCLRQWLYQLVISPTLTEDQWRRVFVYDFQKEANSGFRKAIVKALDDYLPELARQRKEREENKLKVNEPLKIKTTIAFDETKYEIYEDAKKSYQKPFYLLKEYHGRGNETAFIRYLENDQNVEYWYKNGSCGKDDFSIIYYSTIENTKKLFYPDWIVIYQNGDIGIFDTKSGNTSVQESQDTRDKLNALAEFVENLNRVSQKHYIAGIMEPHAGTWNLIEKVSVDL